MKTDLSPKWTQILPVLLNVLATGAEEDRKRAALELSRMAEAADRYNAQTDE